MTLEADQTSTAITKKKFASSCLLWNKFARVWCDEEEGALGLVYLFGGLHYGDSCWLVIWRVFVLVTIRWLTSWRSLDYVALAFWLMSWRTLLHLEGLLYLEDFAMLG